MVGQESAEAGDRIREHGRGRQERDAQMVRLLSIEGSSVDEPNVLGIEEVEYELLVVADRMDFRVQPREDVEAAPGTWQSTPWWPGTGSGVDRECGAIDEPTELDALLWRERLQRESRCPHVDPGKAQPSLHCGR